MYQIQPILYQSHEVQKDERQSNKKGLQSVIIGQTEPPL